MPPIVKSDEERIMDFFSTAHPMKVQVIFNIIKPIVKARLQELEPVKASTPASEPKKRGPKKSSPDPATPSEVVPSSASNVVSHQ